MLPPTPVARMRQLPERARRCDGVGLRAVNALSPRSFCDDAPAASVGVGGGHLLGGPSAGGLGHRASVTWWWVGDAKDGVMYAYISVSHLTRNAENEKRVPF